MFVTPLTRARYGALIVLAGGPCRYSNLTEVSRHGDTIVRVIASSCADWLCEQSYARQIPPCGMVEITDLGRRRLEQERNGTTAQGAR